MTLGSSRAAGGNSAPTYTLATRKAPPPHYSGTQKTLNVKTTKRPPKDVKWSNDQRKNFKSAKSFTCALLATQWPAHECFDIDDNNKRSDEPK